MTNSPRLISFVGASFLEISDLPNVQTSGAVANSRASVPHKGRGSPVTSCPWIAGLLLPQMKYVEKHFTLRIHRRDGTSKLLLGVTGHPPKIGSLKQIKVTQDEVLTIKVVDHPRRDEPAEAIEV